MLRKRPYRTIIFIIIAFINNSCLAQRFDTLISNLPIQTEGFTDPVKFIELKENLFCTGDSLIIEIAGLANLFPRDEIRYGGGISLKDSAGRPKRMFQKKYKVRVDDWRSPHRIVFKMILKPDNKVNDINKEIKDIALLDTLYKGPISLRIGTANKSKNDHCYRLYCYIAEQKSLDALSDLKINVYRLVSE